MVFYQHNDCAFLFHNDVLLYKVIKLRAHANKPFLFVMFQMLSQGLRRFAGSNSNGRGGDGRKSRCSARANAVKASRRGVAAARVPNAFRWAAHG